MYQRFLSVTQNHSFFLFGARGTGKSTLMEEIFSPENTLFINLLNPEEENSLALNPSSLVQRVEALPESITHIVIDEIQKVPKLLDCVHLLIEKTKKIFILTGSSARKLKYGGANLLAGRAFVYNLYPFSFLELGNDFKLNEALEFGLLPKIFQLKNNEDKKLFLQSYAHTYLKEEIWAEQLVRKLDPFRKFLEVAAQSNGKIINYLNIARDIGVDDKTVYSYFQILEDTLIGFYLEPFHTSLRKRVSQKPKFYFFDCGITRALARMLSTPLNPSTSYYGDCFEQFVVCEILKICSYFYPDYKFSYLKTKDDLEVDFIVERPMDKTLFIEIKSTSSIRDKDVSTLKSLIKDFSNAEFICLSNDKATKKIEEVMCYFWMDGIQKFLFPINNFPK
ncbi:MAG: AAA family ATPase [Bdellovibrionota bacterium]